MDRTVSSSLTSYQTNGSVLARAAAAGALALWLFGCAPGHAPQAEAPPAALVIPAATEPTAPLLAPGLPDAPVAAPAEREGGPSNGPSATAQSLAPAAAATPTNSIAPGAGVGPPSASGSPPASPGSGRPPPAARPAEPVGPRPEDTAGVPGVSAEAYLVMDAADGRVLLDRGGDAHRSPASLTKVMTLLLALERGDPAASVTVGDEVLNLRFSTLMGLQPGEQLSLRDLCYGLMYPSGNDTAMAIAAHVAGNVDAFVALMNQRARQLGMWNTSYANPHGLDSRNGDHYTTARDLAVLTRFALQRPGFREIVSGRRWTAKGLRAGHPLVN